MFVSSDRFSYGKNLQTYLDKIFLSNKHIPQKSLGRVD